MLAEEIAHVVGDADEQQRHRDRGIRHDLDELGQLRLHVLVGDAVVFVDDEDRVAVVDAGEHVDEIADRERPLGQELREILDPAAAEAQALGQQRRRHAAQEIAEDLLEAHARAARVLQDEIAGLARLAGEDVAQRGLAAAALAIDDDMRALLLDRGDDALHLAKAPGEHRCVVLGPGRREGVAQERVRLGRIVGALGLAAHP